jgi:branched-chain amino acid transport system substrate-binding protein
MYTNKYIYLLLILFYLSCSKTTSYRIGVMSPFSGNGAVYGEALRQGVELALDKIKSENPYLYNQLELIYEDDKLESTTGINAAQKLIEVDRVKLILGPFTSNVTLAVAPIAEKNRVILISPTATNYKIKDAGEYIFRICPSDALQGKIWAKYAINKINARTVCTLYMNTDYGFGLKEVFESEFKNLGGKILLTEGFDQSTTDFRTRIEKIRALNPDIIFFPSNWNEAGQFFKQMKELRFNKQVLLTDGTYDQQFLELAGNSADHALITTQTWGSGKAKDDADEFKKKFKEKYDKEPGAFNALPYDAMMLISKVLEKTGYDTDKIKNELYKIEYQGITGLTKFNSYGEVEKAYSLFIVKDKQFQLKEEEI